VTADYIKKFYGRHINLDEARGTEDEVSACCPCHADETASFNFNTTSGLYICFNTSCKLGSGGNMAKFLSIIEDIPVIEASDRIKKETKALEPPPPKKRKVPKTTKAFPYTQEDVDQRIAGLINHPERIQYLMDNTFWTLDIMKKYEIGYDAQTKRYWIPIKEHGVLVNIRKYAPNGDPKMIQVTGHSEIRLYPYENLEEREIVIMEGEKDCILANQHGFNAVTITGGAGTFKPEWKDIFRDKDIVICYDIDEAGKVGARKIEQILLGVSRSIRVVDLPIEEPDNADYTDWIMQGATPIDFRALIGITELGKPESTGPIDIPDEVFDVSLDKVSQERLFYKRARMKVRVIAKDSAPSIIPKSITVACNRDNGKMCYVCPLAEESNRTQYKEITESTPEILQLIECTTRDRRNIIRDLFNIAPCRKFTIKETDHQGITRCSVIPSIDDVTFDTSDYNQKYVERDMYVLSYQIEANMDYELKSIAMPDPKNQTLVHLVYEVNPSDSSIEEFKMTPDLKKELEIFQCSSETS